MAYTNDKLDPRDPGLGALSRPEGQTIKEALLAVLLRRNRQIKRRMAEIDANASGRYGEDDGLDGDALT